MSTRLLLLCLISLTPGCLTIGKRMVDVERPLVTTENGVVYEDLLPGLGEVPTLGSRVTLDYTCWLEDETEVDSTYSRGQAVEFEYGKAWLPGINEGLAGMRAGGTRRMTIPADLAYGPDGVEGLVPPNSPLVFEIELVSVVAPDAE